MQPNASVNRLNFSIFLLVLFLFKTTFCLAYPSQENLSGPTLESEISCVYHFMDPLETTPENTTPFYIDFGDWLIDNRADWSAQVNSIGKRMDSFFSTKDSLEKHNASYLKIGMETRYGKFGEYKFEPVFRFKLDLPTLKEHLRIVIDSDPDDTKSLAERTRDQTLLESERTSTSPTGQLQLLTEEFQHWESTMSVGTKFRVPLDPFWKIKSDRFWELSDDWFMSVRQSFFYYHVNGWGESTQLTFEKPLTDKLIFRSFTEAEWVHQERSMELAQVWSIQQEINRKRAIKYQFGILGQTHPGPEVSDYYINAVYKRLLYKTWLYYEVIPELFFPRDENFELNPAITLRFEMLLSND